MYYAIENHKTKETKLFKRKLNAVFEHVNYHHGERVAFREIKDRQLPKYLVKSKHNITQVDFKGGIKL